MSGVKRVVLAAVALASATLLSACDPALNWDEAYAHVGESQEVCGDLQSTGQSDGGFFLNIGRDYPEPDRFTIVVWDGDARLPGYPIERRVCVTGEIVDYQGTAQIHVDSIDDVSFAEWDDPRNDVGPR